MDTLLQVLRFINLFAAALVAGGQVCVLLVIIPTKRRFAVRDSVLVHNAMLGHQIDYYMKPSGITSAVTAVIILLLGGLIAGVLPRSAVSFYFVGLVGTGGVVILSRFFNVPTNRMMAEWSLDAIPDDYPDVRRRWDLVHTVRAGCGVLAFTGYALATLACVGGPAA
jgi:hypothetical protein